MGGSAATFGIFDDWAGRSGIKKCSCFFKFMIGTQNSMYIHQEFHQVRYQGIVKATVTEGFEDLKFKISEGSDQNWSCPDSALLAVSAKQLCSEPSEILNLMSSNTLETVAFNIPWYLEV